ncbi:Glycogen synthase [Candidatus Nanosyncoccus alces]|uniref:Glycogen synthase n=2 Tax=Candidatus Nanosyncoccus alces TaxID=2171997 RepID=A0ABY0FKW9_9BACT|nr:Glycogen synthase [Candidatus Nanosyncoccus alces]
MLGWELPPHNSGGLGVACLNMARALAGQGADIDFVVPYEAEHPEIKFMKVLSATHLDPIYRYGGGAYESLKLLEKIIPSINKEELLSIRDVQKSYCDFVEKYLTEFKPDIVHAHDWLTYEAGVLAKKNFGIPLVAHVHATEFDRAGMRMGNPLIHEVEREGLMLADQIIAVSETTKRIIHDKYHIPLSKIHVVYNSLDENYEKSDYNFDQDAYGYLRKLKTTGYTVVSTVGRFTIQKGLHNLMRAAALAISKNPKLIFVFAGDGEERNELVGLAADLGISKNVIFTGFIRGKKLRDIYSISDIFVMSSISEPFGLTALEAAHHGDVLILTKQSGVSEIIWSALKYDFWDEKKLADQIIAVSQNSALRETLQHNVKREYHKISWDQVAKKCLKIYNKTMKHKGFN